MDKHQHIQKLEQAEKIILQVAQEYVGYGEFKTLQKEANNIREFIGFIRQVN